MVHKAKSVYYLAIYMEKKKSLPTHDRCSLQRNSGKLLLSFFLSGSFASIFVSPFPISPDILFWKVGLSLSVPTSGPDCQGSNSFCPITLANPLNSYVLQLYPLWLPLPFLLYYCCFWPLSTSISVMQKQKSQGLAVPMLAARMELQLSFHTNPETAASHEASCLQPFIEDSSPRN